MNPKQNQNNDYPIASFIDFFDRNDYRGGYKKGISLYFIKTKTPAIKLAILVEGDRNLKGCYNV
ncbi:hypothetical protein ACS77C_01360 [Yersinia enterocolitica]|uniref:hypothetical protein n=1 Tax=Yersinia enterocolitica TaxID=630 RepID=UPI003F432DCB